MSQFLKVTITHKGGVELDDPVKATIPFDCITGPIGESTGGFALIPVNPNSNTTAGKETWQTSETYDQVTALTLSYADANINNVKRTILQGAGSITDGVVAGTYGLTSAGEAVVVSGGNFAAPPVLQYIDLSDYPTVNGLPPKFTLRTTCNVNNVAPTGNFTLGLYPVTRPGSSGGAGVCIFDYGTVVADSTNLYAAPAADSQGRNSSNAFTISASGWYAIGVVSTATVAASSHVQFTAQLQAFNA